MNVDQWRDFASIMVYGKMPEKKGTNMNNNSIAELLERAESMLNSLDQRHVEEESDVIGYPHMQNLCQLMQTIAQLKSAIAFEQLAAAALRAEEREINS